MKILKPSWVNHDNFPIFSVDIHPDDTKFATGGQGTDNVGRVAIWNLLPILREEDDNERVPKLLCQLDHHNACVNCVRWSQSGNLLASGGDDKIIIIWKLASRSMGGPVNSAFGKTNYEQWKVASQLTSHNGDVLDLAWSPNDKYLASASVDNTAIVWDAQKFPQIVYVLKGHSSLVKGVTWDPIGKYIATQSDDKSLRIWRTSDWSQECEVTTPFLECGGTTHVLRLGWSPDGLYLVSAHAMNGGGPTAQIIERDEWKTDKDFVGHRKAVVCARFNKNIMASSSDVKGSIVAIGSRDMSISVWTTSLKRPVIVIKDMFTNSVMDLSWSTSGTVLIGCSYDGSIIVTKFGKSEIGTPISAEERDQLYKKHYGKNIMNHCDIIQDLDIYLAKKSIEAEQDAAYLSKKNTTINPIFSETSEIPIIKGPVDRQIETVTKEGKRRITPKFIVPSAVDISDISMGQSSNPQQIFISSSDQMESNKGKVNGNLEGNENKSPESSLIPNNVDKESNLFDKPNTIKMAKSSSTPSENALTSAQDNFPEIKKQKKITITDEIHENGGANAKKPRLDQDQMQKLNKQPLNHNYANINKNITNRLQQPQPSVSSLIASHNHLPSPSRSTVSAINKQPIARNRFPPLKLDNTAVTNVSTKIGGYILDIENSASGSIISCVHKPNSYNELTWKFSTDSRICSISGNEQMIIAACDDATIHVFDLKGCYVFPPLLVSSQISKIKQKGDYCLILTTKGNLYIWNINNKTNVIKNESVLSLINQPNSIENGKSNEIVDINVTSNGLPLVSISNGKAFIYSLDMATWMQYSDPCGPVSSALRRRIDNNGLFFEPNFNIAPDSKKPKPPTTILSNVKLRLASAYEVKANDEVQHCLLVYAKTLAKQELEKELRLLCQDLLGPTFSGSESSNWQPLIAGISKRYILQQILTDLLKEGLNWQDFYSEFKNQLDLVQLPIVNGNGC